MFTNRQKKILEYFSKTDTYIRSKDLASRLGVTSRTIVSDIQSINANNNKLLKINSERGRGYKIEIFDNEKLKSILSSNSNSVELNIKDEQIYSVSNTRLGLYK